MGKSIKARSLVHAGLIAGSVFFFGSALAVPIAPGATVALPGTTNTIHPNLTGMVVADTLRPFSFMIGATTYTGQLQDRVVKESASGTLDFYYRIWLDKQVVQGDQMWVARYGFPQSPTGGGISADVDYRIDGSGLSAPVVAERSSNGTEIIFRFRAYTIGTNSQSTRFTFVSTNATTYHTGGLIRFQVQGGTIVSLNAYEPG